MNVDQKESKEDEEDLRILHVLTADDDWKEGADDPTTLHSELAALHYKKERLACELQDVRQQVLHKDSAIQRLERDADQLREKAARQAAVLVSLRKRLQESEEKERNSSSANARSDMALETLRRENRHLGDKLADTESRLRTVSAEKQASEHNLQDLTHKLGIILGVEDISRGDRDALVHRLNQILQDNGRLRSKATSLSENMHLLESECKSNREALGRITDERDALQRQVSSQLLGTDRIRKEKEELETSRLMLDREVAALQETLQATSRALSSANSDLSLQQTQSRQLKEELKASEQRWQKKEAENAAFLSNLSAMVSDSSRQVDSSQDAIRERLREILSDLQDKSTLLEALREKVSGASEDLSRKEQTNETLSRRLRGMEEEKQELEERMRKLEGEVATLQVARDHLLLDKHKFASLLDDLAHALRLEEVSREVSDFHLQAEALITRAEQLVRLEGDKLAGKTSAVYQLQRRVKNLQEQIRKKEVHLDLLRRKVQILEEGVRSRGSLEEQKDNALAKMRRLLKTVERLEFQVSEANAHIRSLKAELADAAEFKIAALERGRQVEELQKRIAELELVRTKCTRKILLLKDQLRSSGSTLDQERMTWEQRSRILREELSDTRMALADASRRQNQLAQLRDHVARSLGLDVPASDLEMLSRLDKIVRARREYALVSRRYEDAQDAPTAAADASSALLQVPPAPAPTTLSAHALLDDSGYLDPDDTFRDDVDAIYNRRPTKSPLP